MLKIVKRLPLVLSLIAIAFLIIQIVGALWLPLVTADIVNIGIKLQMLILSGQRGF